MEAGIYSKFQILLLQTPLATTLKLHVDVAITGARALIAEQKINYNMDGGL